MKPRNLTAQLRHTSARLREASASRDLDGLTLLDREMRGLAAMLAGQAQWQAAEQRALELLKTDVRASLSVLAEESRELSARMRELNQHRQGWVAYAMHEDDDTGLAS